MKKALIFTTVFFMLVSMTSCKKLLGWLDREYMLTYEPWKGVESKIIDNNGTVVSHVDMSDFTYEFIRKTYRFIEYQNGAVKNEGDWEFDKEDNELYLYYDSGFDIHYNVTKLTNSKMVWEAGSNFKLIVVFER